jgi:hypothetical protein
MNATNSGSTSCAMADRVIIDALASADHHGVAIRIVLNPRERHDFVALGYLSEKVRIKAGYGGNAPSAVDRKHPNNS